jgi:hypothetical protein
VANESSASPRDEATKTGGDVERKILLILLFLFSFIIMNDFLLLLINSWQEKGSKSSSLPLACFLLVGFAIRLLASLFPLALSGTKLPTVFRPRPEKIRFR